MNRRILNEDQLVEGLLSIPSTFHPQHFSHLHLTFVDFARIHISHQLQLVGTADLLIGVHGAALSHAMFLPEKGALLELQPQAQNWRIFQHMQQWSHRQGVGKEGLEGLDAWHGSNYGEWRNHVPGRERRDDIGDGVEVDVGEVKAEVIRLLSWRDRREGGVTNKWRRIWRNRKSPVSAPWVENCTSNSHGHSGRDVTGKVLQKAS